MDTPLGLNGALSSGSLQAQMRRDAITGEPLDAQMIGTHHLKAGITCRADDGRNDNQQQVRARPSSVRWTKSDGQFREGAD